MIDKLDIFYTVDTNVDEDENNYCVNCNFEKMYNKINELIEIINEMKENEVIKYGKQDIK